MKNTIAILMIPLLAVAGCSRPSEADRRMEKALIGHWVIDIPQTTPRQRATLEQRGFSPDELEKRMEMLLAVHRQGRMEIAPSTIAMTELGETREMSYVHAGGGRLTCTFNGITAPVFVKIHEDGTLNFEESEMSFVVWKKENHNKTNGR